MKSTKQKTRANTPPPRPAQARGKSAPAAAPALAAKAHLWRYGVAIAAAFCALLIVYGPALNGPFLLDDTYLPYMLPQFADAPLSVWLKYVRPMLMLTFWMNYVRSGHDTYAYHFFNIVLHLSNGLWIYLAIRKLLDFERVKTWAREVASVFAAGLFLLHPLQTESVSYVASRSETLSVFFVLAAFVVFVYSRGARITWPRAAAVIVLFGAAVLSKEHTVVLLPLLLLTDYYWNPGFSFRGIAKNWRLYAPLAVAGCFGAWFVWRVLRAATTAGFSVKGLPWYDYLFTECRVIWIYVRLFIAPFGLNLDRDVPISRSVIDYGAIIGLIGLVALAAAAWIYRRKFPLASYGYFVFLLLLAPTSSIVPLADPYAERRMYLPFIGLLLIVAEFLSRWKAARNTILLTLAGVLAVQAAVTYQRNQLWGNAIAIWKDTSDKSPRKVRPNFQLASAYYDAGRCGDAVNQYAYTANLQKPTYDLVLDWALAYDCAGNSAEALAKLQQAAAIEKNAHVYSQIGMEYAKQAKYADALAALNTSLSLDPSFDISLAYRGNIYAIQGDKARAVADYQQALKINPRNSIAIDGLRRLTQ